MPNGFALMTKVCIYIFCVQRQAKKKKKKKKKKKYIYMKDVKSKVMKL